MRQADQDRLPVALDRGRNERGEIGDRAGEPIGFVADEMEMDFVGGRNGSGIASGPDRYDHGAIWRAADMQRYRGFVSWRRLGRENAAHVTPPGSAAPETEPLGERWLPHRMQRALVPGVVH
ncbi:MAG TPA: hypothetical protein VIG34_09975 [Xanthobacteraceae bacterium]